MPASKPMRTPLTPSILSVIIISERVSFEQTSYFTDETGCFVSVGTTFLLEGGGGVSTTEYMEWESQEPCCKANEQLFLVMIYPRLFEYAYLCCP
jgi:hypothetical protein